MTRDIERDVFYSTGHLELFVERKRYDDTSYKKIPNKSKRETDWIRRGLRSKGGEGVEIAHRAVYQTESYFQF